MRYPAFHRPDAMVALRCACVFSCHLIFTSKFFRLPDTPLAHAICFADGSPNKQQLWQFGLFVGGEKQSHCMPFDFHSPIMCMVVIFRENSPVAIIAADSKWSFWAEWTVMKNCRSQFAWPRAQLKESAIRRIVERQVVYNSWTTGPGADSAAAVSAADSSSGAGNGGATSTAAILFPGLPSEFRLRPL